MAPQVQAGATTRVPSRMIIIAKRNMWIVPDTLLQTQEGAIARVHMHMSPHHDTTRSVIDIHWLMIAIDLHLRVIAITIVQLIRAFDMHLLMIVIDIHWLMIAIDLHLRVIFIDIHLLMIAIDLHLRVIVITLVQLLRTFDMHRPMIATAIVQLTIVIDTNMEMNQGEHLLKLQGCRHMRKPPMMIYQGPRG